MATKKQCWSATGRRKRSSAQVTLTSGTGKITVNGVDVNEYMPYATLVMDLKQPLVLTNNENKFDVITLLENKEVDRFFWTNWSNSFRDY